MFTFHQAFELWIAQIQIRLPGNINLSSQVTLGGGFASVTSMQANSPDWAEASSAARSGLRGGDLSAEATRWVRYAPFMGTHIWHLIGDYFMKWWEKEHDSMLYGCISNLFLLSPVHGCFFLFGVWLSAGLRLNFVEIYCQHRSTTRLANLSWMNISRRCYFHLLQPLFEINFLLCHITTFSSASWTKGSGAYNCVGNFPTDGCILSSHRWIFLGKDLSHWDTKKIQEQQPSDATKLKTLKHWQLQ